MAILINVVLFWTLLVLVFYHHPHVLIPHARRLLGGLLLLLGLLPLGVWHALLYIQAKEHWLAAPYGLRQYQPESAMVMCLEVMFVGLVLVIAGMLLVGEPEGRQRRV